ncbi:heterokaryon incompatibility protein-domain-containing protein [Rhypophila decipiens]|uniref:Heterokaryon incompatibility protein-domain-containing protein n=1 Tax=Rhypophila decipiens TaxID=261697 RepID=A0AAN7B1F3_9PEZI|nr:heterokaryon incompatibility protein-domain-containing protein [Rhypophila decipiens]
MSDTTPKPSLYGAKSLGSHQIRLLYLNPAHESDTLTGHLEVVDLKKCPPYEALSYEWGSPEKPCIFTATENNHRVNITESLYHALRDLRHAAPAPAQEPSGQRVIWADGICINQEDLDERGSQVSIMASIYRGASRVITYIGHESDGSTAAVALAASLLGAFEDRVKVDLQDASGLAKAGLPPITDKSWKALKELCLRRWAGRCWCAQEFLCNKDLIMMCGRTVFPAWTTLLSVVRLVYARQLPAAMIPSHDEDPDSLRDCLISLINLRSPLQYMLKPQRKQLLKLLQSFHPFQVSDPRDKVYSLLGHSLDHEHLGIEVDYTISPEQLYTTVAAEIATEYQDLRLLLSNLHHKSLSNLPSWVPDWSTWYFGSDLGGAGYDHTLFASGHTRASLKVIGTRLQTKLSVSGCLLDTITWVGDEILPYYTTHEKPVATRRRGWITKQLEVVRKLDPYPYLGNSGTQNPDITTVLWKTLISNTNHDESIAKAEYVDYFNAHYHHTDHPDDARGARDNDASDMSEKARRFCDAVRWRSRYRRVATTESGYFGAVPQKAQVGDILCLFQGGRHLYIVRPVDSGQLFKYVGHAYVHGLMGGEIVREEWYQKKKGEIILV